MDAKKLQEEIKKLIREVGWTQAEAARIVYCDNNDTDNEEEIRRYVERFKKLLCRKTTPPERLANIMNVLRCQRAAEKTGRIKLNYVPGSKLDATLRDKMILISREFDREMESDSSTGYMSNSGGRKRKGC